MSKKGGQVFQEKNRGVTPSVAAAVTPTLVTPLLVYPQLSGVGARRSYDRIADFSGICAEFCQLFRANVVKIVLTL